jgi:DNA repair exonuclease SbcCD nuclease subunit
VKLALIGDLHLDERSVRYQHCLQVLDWTIQNAITVHDVDGFIFLGDLCEGIPTPHVFSALATRFNRIRKAGSWPAIVQGNHEDYETGMMLAWLDVRDVAWNTMPTLHDEASILLVPYPRRGRPPFEDLGDTDTISGSMMAAARRIHRELEIKLKAATAHGVPLIVCGHFTVAGMRTRDAEFEAHQATEVVVPPELLHGAALVAVGHIHKAQDVTPTIIGVGSLIRHSFAEADDEKSYTLVTVAGSQVTWERIPVPARKMIALQIQWPMSGFDEGVLTGFLSEPDEVKLTVSIPEDQLATFDASVFDPIKERAAHFLLEKVALPVERTRAPEIAKAATLSQQVRTWLEATEQRPDPARLDRLMAKVDEVSR